MPNSSRRKQSKPQHLRNDEDDNNSTSQTGSQPVTSAYPSTGDQSTQETAQYGSNVTGDDLSRSAITADDSIADEMEHSHGSPGSDSQDGVDESVNHSLSQNQSLPHDLTVKVTNSEADGADKKAEDFDFTLDVEGDGMLPVYTPPTMAVADRFCVYCNLVKKSPADLERHLRKHTGDAPFCCKDCPKRFKSKRSLQHHQFSMHGLESDEITATQRYLNKRSLDLSQPITSLHGEVTSSNPTYSSCSNQSAIGISAADSPVTEYDSASKRPRVADDNAVFSQCSGAITTPTSSSSDLTSDQRMAQSIEACMKMATTDGVDTGADSGGAAGGCPVCGKVFIKPCDMKRHMMCHTGEKPFRCEFCSKPFRAKSSMHYHLKAAHGIEIELSPGLEERYMRMKTRAQMNLVQRNQLAGLPAMSGLGQYTIDDIDEVEDDSQSMDSMSSSFYQHSGISSDLNLKSQGHFSSNTGSNEDCKTAIDLSVSDRSGQQMASGNVQGAADDTTNYGEVLINADSPFRKNKISVRNETVLVTRLDGMNLINGRSASIFKCYLCGTMFTTLSKMQCHLSLHFEKRLTTYSCCFCDEMFQFKVQMRNHIRRKHFKNGGNAANGKSNTKDIESLQQTRGSNDTGKAGEPVERNEIFICRYCRKDFATRDSLNRHMRLHFWNRNCFCRICGKSFNQYTSLQLHMSRFHWKTIGKSSKRSPLGKKFNFFNTYRFKQDTHDGVEKQNCLENAENINFMKGKTYQNHTSNRAPVVNSNDVTVVLPQSPPLDNGEISDTATSHHSSENNWADSLPENGVLEIDESGTEILTAPKRLLMPVRRAHSPRNRSPRKSTPTYLPNQNHMTSENNVPLNFIKSEMTQQDSNNNESSSSSQELPNHSSPDDKAGLSSPDASIPAGYSMNATSHLLMAKALAAHQTLTHHLNPTSQSLLFPNHLPPSIAAMMTLPSMSIQVPGIPDRHSGTSKSPSPASHTSSKSDMSPDDRDSKEAVKDALLGFPRINWAQKAATTPENWTFHQMYNTPETHTDGRKVTSLSRTHSRLGIVHSPVNRESLCKPTVMNDGRTVYKCPFCSKEFVSFSDINRHMDFHEDIRPYKCQYCDYYARTNSQLKVHMMRHQGIREFCCKLCNYKGVTQSDLNRHMKSQIHLLKSRNACGYCGEGFVTPKNLEKHLDGNCIVKVQGLNGGLDMPMQESIA